MSEEKMYVVKNDEGKYWDFYSSGFWKPDSIDCIATPIKKQAELVIKYNGGHVVTLIEEPEKVVVSEEEAKMMKRLRTDENESPAGAIRNYFWGSVEGQNVDNKPRWSRENEARLMCAYVNGYTVKKESRYMVYVPGTNNKFLYNKRGDNSTRAAKLETPIVPSPVTSYQTAYGQYKPLYWFTDAEITKFGLQDCEKEEVTDDDE